MMPIRSGIIIIAAVCLVLTGCAAETESSGNAVKPNVLFIAIDDLRPELACYGDTQVKTPNIDKLAAEGTIFSRAYCQVPVCGASRASLMTGILPTPTRFVGHDAWAEKDARDAKTMGQVFKEAGYTTLANGKIFHHTTDTNDRSWSRPAWAPGIDHMHSLDPETTRILSEKQRGRIYEMPDVPDNVYKDGLVAEKTIQDLRQLKAEGKPFFLACGFIRPHMPFYAPKKYWDLYNRDQIQTADNQFRPENAPKSLRGSGEFKVYYLDNYNTNSQEFHRMMRHGYLACTSYADKLTGDVLNELDRLGLADNTIVVIWGDHGWHLGEHNFWGKHNTLHNALRVPLIIKVPGRTSGRKTEALVENVDIFPTLCSLAGLTPPESVQGRSFQTLFDDPGQDFKDFTYSRFKSADAVVTDRYAYTRYENGDRMLYDRKVDPQENKNVVDDPAYSKVVEQLETQLQSRMQDARAFVNN